MKKIVVIAVIVLVIAIVAIISRQTKTTQESSVPSDNTESNANRIPQEVKPPVAEGSIEEELNDLDKLLDEANIDESEF